MNKRTKLLPIFFLFISVIAYAGTAYQLRCTRKKCAYTTTIGIGGGMRYQKVTGYCTTCSNFVGISWSTIKSDSDASAPKSPFLTSSPPKRLGTVWSPATGRLTNLYPCPTCKHPFMEVFTRDFEIYPKKVLSLVLGLIDDRLEDLGVEVGLTIQNRLLELARDIQRREESYCPRCQSPFMEVIETLRYD